VMTLALKI